MRARTLYILVAGLLVVCSAQGAAVRAESRGLKPGLVAARNVRSEVRTYLRSKAKGRSLEKDESGKKSKAGLQRLIVPAAMKGSHEILVRQNEMADHDGLSRVQDDDDLEDMRHSRLLVAIPNSTGMRTDERLPANRRYCRPWTAQFLTTLGKAYLARFHSALQVNSAVRTVEFQEQLIRTNGNAAPAEGETASPHLTGQAVDLAKKGLSLAQIAWLRGYLLPLVQQGKVDVEEEFQQACFHVSVYKKYVPVAAAKKEIAQGRAALAAAVR